MHGGRLEVGDAAPVDVRAVDRVAYSRYFFEVNGLPQVCGGDDVDDFEVHLLPLLGDCETYLTLLRVGEGLFLAFFAVEGFDVEVIVSPFLPRRLSVAITPHTFSHRPQRLFVQLSFFLLPRSNKVFYLGIVDHLFFLVSFIP